LYLDNESYWPKLVASLEPTDMASGKLLLQASTPVTFGVTLSTAATTQDPSIHFIKALRGLAISCILVHIVLHANELHGRSLKAGVAIPRPFSGVFDHHDIILPVIAQHEHPTAERGSYQDPRY
jgi:hypothetical protein